MFKLNANYIDIIQALRLPSSFYEIQSLDAYDSQVEKDLSRMAFLDFVFSVLEIQEKLRQRPALDSELSFTQGNFDGSALTESQHYTSALFQKTQQSSAEENTRENAYGGIDFAYVDDEGKNCAFSLRFVRDDSDIQLPVAERALHFSMALIKNTNQAPGQREVIYYTDPIFTPFLRAEEVEVVDNKDLFADLNENLGSKKLAQLFRDLFLADSLNLPYLKELQSRLHCNQNLDNRDAKKVFLAELIKLGMGEISLRAELQKLIEAAENDIHFYRDEHFNQVLTTLQNTLISHFSLAEEAEQAQKVRYTYLAISCDLLTFALEEDAILSNLYRQKACELRNATLADKDLTFNNIQTEIQHKATQLSQLQGLIRDIKNRCSDDKNLNRYLQSLKAGLEEDPQFFVHAQRILEEKRRKIDDYLTQKEAAHVKNLAEKLTQFSQQLSPDCPPFIADALTKEVQRLNNCSAQQASACRNDNLASRLAEVQTQLKKDEKDALLRKYTELGKQILAPSPLSQTSFFSRNRYALLLGLSCFVTTFAIVASLTGVLVPLGATLFIGATLLGSIGSGGLAVATLLTIISSLASAKISRNERVYRHQALQYQASSQDYQLQREKLNAAYRAELQDLNNLIQSQLSLPLEMEDWVEEHIEIQNNAEPVPVKEQSSASQAFCSFFASDDQQEIDQQITEDNNLKV